LTALHYQNYNFSSQANNMKNTGRTMGEEPDEEAQSIYQANQSIGGSRIPKKMAQSQYGRFGGSFKV